MAYIADADIEERLGPQAYVQLTDDDGDGVANVGVVEEARLGAEGEVNSYLAHRWTVPIDVSVHPELANVLASITLDLVECRLRSRRPPVPADVIRKRAHAVDWLKSVAEGRIKLPSAVGLAPNTTQGAIASSTGAGRTLSRDALADY
ncbi:MAG: DUF1320 family protein [Phycisphaerales bacterium]|nr:MAG: DUF1320 family protein [Phycisphaerales bacterium]